MAQILVIDDDRLLNETLCDMLARKQHFVESAYSVSEGLAKARGSTFDIIFLDVQLPDGNGLDIIPQLKETDSEPEIIIMTGRGDENGAEIAIKHGAWSYVEKSSVTRDLILPLTRVLQYRDEKSSGSQFSNLDRGEIVGSSNLINKSLKLAADASKSDVNILIRGETGTGKEVFASTIHRNSSRATQGNFVVVDCASLPESLVESILFGHVKGAYTGADIPRKGLVRQAHGGTLFLDEIGELPLPVQKSFLRVLQERRYRPVGGVNEETSDFRLIAATNRNLDEMADTGAFRKDLLFRVHSLEIELPPLRARGKDILELADYFQNQLCSRYGKERKYFSPGFMEALMAYSWPGNVRELSNVMERVFITELDNSTFHPEDLTEEIRVEHIKSTLKKEKFIPPPVENQPDKVQLGTWREYKDKAELDYMQLLLAEADKNIKEARRISGLSKARIYQLINKHGLNNKSS